MERRRVVIRPDDGVLANDTDVEGDALTATVVSGPSNASSFTLNSNGTFSYTHDGGETTSDSFTYRSHDASDSSGVTTVDLTVTPVNDPPVGVADDFYTVAEEGTLTTTDVDGTTTGGDQTDDGVLANDTDVEGDPLTATVVSGPSSASAFTLNLDGTFSYTHDGGETRRWGPGQRHGCGGGPADRDGGVGSVQCEFVHPEQQWDVYLHP